MADTDQTAIGIGGLIAVQGDSAGSHIGPTFALIAEAQFFKLDGLGDGEAIMDLNHVDIFRSQFRGFIGHFTGFLQMRPFGTMPTAIRWIFITIYVILQKEIFLHPRQKNQCRSGLLCDIVRCQSGLMIGFVIGIGGVGTGILGVAADAWGVLTVVKLMATLPILGLIPLLMLSSPSGREGTRGPLAPRPWRTIRRAASPSATIWSFRR